MKHIEQTLREKAAAFVRQDEKNLLERGCAIYDEPLVGFASARDELFLKLKEETIIGQNHKSPDEWLPDARGVVSFFLPFTAEVRLSNHKSGLASEEWLRARFDGESFNNRLRQFIIDEIHALGGMALAPVLEKDFLADNTKYRSNWSERHAAFIAGLGTFSLNRGLITPRGMAGRFGSVVTDIEFTLTARPYGSPFAYCPFLVDGSCGVCIERCPTGAISAQGKDKKLCHQYIFVEDPLKTLRLKFGYPYSSCGKCQTAVPCETEIP